MALELVMVYPGQYGYQGCSGLMALDVVMVPSWPAWLSVLQWPMALDVVMVPSWSAWLSGLQWPDDARCCYDSILASLAIRAAVA